MKALVIYDSVFGNTEKIAQAVGKALGSSKNVKVINVKDAQANQLKGLDVLIVASPTRGFRPTEGIANFLKNLPPNALKGIRASAFDTRIRLDTIKSPIFRFIVGKGGYADKRIVETLQKKGAEVLLPTQGFYVKESEGPLEDGELERAVAWATSLLKES